MKKGKYKRKSNSTRERKVDEGKDFEKRTIAKRKKIKRTKNQNGKSERNENQLRKLKTLKNVIPFEMKYLRLLVSRKEGHMEGRRREAGVLAVDLEPLVL